MNNTSPDMDAAGAGVAGSDAGGAAMVAGGGGVGGQGADERFLAATAEMKSLFDVRRLMFILVNIILPGVVMGATDCISGSSYPPELAWFPRHVLLLSGAAITVTGLFVGLILMRCHLGLVIHSAKARYAMEGVISSHGINWLGVTANFIILVGLAAGAGLAMALAPLAARFALPIWLAPAAGAGVPPLLLLFLLMNHARGNRVVNKLRGGWTGGAVADGAQEGWARMSMDAANQDMAVVVTMAAALFTGFFAAMTSFGSIAPDLATDISPDLLRRHGVSATAAYLVISLLLSARMVARLRIAIAAASDRLAVLRQEVDNPWRFRFLERTFLLFLFVLTLTAGALAILLRSVGVAALPAAGAATGAVLLGVIWYPLTLARGRRKYAAKNWL
ncbi:MAG: hypothetical protein HY719_09015 [Planctomycetes bacterium]|nr:hypothetical protein [Planctomycetota bacterium]